MKPRSEREAAEIVYGIHPVMEALESGLRTIERILVAREGGTAAAGRLLRAAREAGIPVTHLPREVLARRAGRRAVHQGVVAVVSAIPYSDVESVCAAAAAEPGGTLLVIDGVEDPRNLGAILRAGAAAGCAGALLSSESTVGLTPVVAKASAGAAERIPVAREPRLRRRLERLRERGFTVAGLESRGGIPWDEVDLSGRLALVAGGEGRGLRRSTLEACDPRITIPLSGGVESLNVSVAVGVVLFEAVRQRRGRRRSTAPTARTT